MDDGHLPTGRHAPHRTVCRCRRYTEGQGFGAHFDANDTCPACGLPSAYTLLLYLTDVPPGTGETVFYKSKGREVLSVRPEAGLALLHAQGAECLLHEGRPEGRGRRQVASAQ